MAVQILDNELITSSVVAVDLPFDEFIQRFVDEPGRYEWVRGVVLKMSPAAECHNDIWGYLAILFSAYFELRPIGKASLPPFVMRLPSSDTAREPDLLVVLNSNPHEKTSTYIDGAADICVEVVSPESVERDTSTKFSEYERGGVREYWLINPLDETAQFFCLGDDGRYVEQPHENDSYTTPLLPGLVVHVPTLWKVPLPGALTVGDAVREMLRDDS